MERTKILIVDDEHLVRWSIRYFLEKEGFCAVEASSAAEALEIMNSGNIRVLITDLMMPGMHGVDLINQALETSPDLDILVITAVDDKEILDRAQNAGALNVFSKPIRFKDLVNTIHELDRGGKGQRPGARH